MKNLKHTIYTVLIILGTIASIVFYYYVFSLIEKNNIAVKHLEFEIKKIEEQKHKIRDIKKDIEKTEELRASLKQYLLTSGDIVRFFDALETESKVANVKFAITSASEIAKDKPFKFELRTVGNYMDNYHFLKILESLPYNLKITNYNLVYAEGLSDPALLQDQNNTIDGWEMTVALELLLKE